MPGDLLGGLTESEVGEFITTILMLESWKTCSCSAQDDGSLELEGSRIQHQSKVAVLETHRTVAGMRVVWKVKEIRDDVQRHRQQKTYQFRLELVEHGPFSSSSFPFIILPSLPGYW